MELINNQDERERTLALEREEGWDVSPAIEGKVTFGDLKAFRDINDIKKELTARNAMPAEPHNFTKLRKALRQHEWERQRNLPSNKGIPDKEIDELAKHFKIMSEERVFTFVDEE